MINIDGLRFTVDEGVSPVQLHDTWLRLFARRNEAAKTAAAMWQQWKAAPDGPEANWLWSRYSAFQSDYRVLAARTDLFHTAWVFATDGHGCRFLPSDTTSGQVLVSAS